jgi:DNA-binding response OmpR family regulator
MRGNPIASPTKVVAMERGPDQPRILVVDDESGIVDVLEKYLRDEGFAVSRAGDGVTAVELALRERPDLVILDLNLPKLSGIEAFRRIRAELDVPVIMLTARIGEVDRIVGLELGADDYVSKPFSPREVVARVKTVLRRAQRRAPSPAAGEVQRVGDVEIDRAGHVVRFAGQAVNLTPMEFRILEVLASNIGRTFTREQLLDKVSADGDVFDRTLDRHVANLRHKIERDPTHPRLIVTVFGVGYKLVAEK